jgi:hypothetical protein
MQAQCLLFFNLLMNDSPKPAPEKLLEFEFLFESFPCHQNSAVLTMHNAVVRIVGSID